MKLHKKIKHNERSKSCFSNNTKTTEANLTKLHRRIEHNEKVCEMICHNRNEGSLPKVRVTQKSKTK